jgi:hypothetical protein
LGYHFCEASLLVLLVIVVACSLADTSRQSRFLASLYANQLCCVDSGAPPPSAVLLVLGLLVWG